MVLTMRGSPPLAKMVPTVLLLVAFVVIVLPDDVQGHGYRKGYSYRSKYSRPGYYGSRSSYYGRKGYGYRPSYYREPSYMKRVYVPYFMKNDDYDDYMETKGYNYVKGGMASYIPSYTNKGDLVLTHIYDSDDKDYDHLHLNGQVFYTSPHTHHNNILGSPGLNTLGTGVGTLGTGVGTLGTGVGTLGTGVGTLGTGVGTLGTGVGTYGTGVGTLGMAGVGTLGTGVLGTNTYGGVGTTALGTPNNLLG